jgi:hypothetical protein
MSADVLARLSRWYTAQCDGDWEHHQGISIQSCDNPGWWVKINLKGANVADRPFTPIRLNVGDDGHVLPDPKVDHYAPIPSWLHCHIQDGVWHGAGNETRLHEILTIFVDWAEAAPA